MSDERYPRLVEGVAASHAVAATLAARREANAALAEPTSSPQPQPS